MHNPTPLGRFPDTSERTVLRFGSWEKNGNFYGTLQLTTALCKLFPSKKFWQCLEIARWFSSNNICLLQIFSHLPRNLFPCIAKLQSRLLPSTRPSGTPIFVNRAAQNSFEIYSTQYWNICQIFLSQLTVRDESVVTEKPLSSDIWPASKWIFKTQPLVKYVSFHCCVLNEHCFCLGF